MGSKVGVGGVGRERWGVGVGLSGVVSGTVRGSGGVRESEGERE